MLFASEIVAQEHYVKPGHGVIIITEENFQKEVLESDVPVLLDAYADYCAPCRAMLPVFAQLAKELGGKIKFVKVDITKEYAVSDKLKIQYLPTFVFYKDGEAIDRCTGWMEKSDLHAKCVKAFSN